MAPECFLMKLACTLDNSTSSVGPGWSQLYVGVRDHGRDSDHLSGISDNVTPQCICTYNVDDNS